MNHDTESLILLYELAGGLPHKAPSYTCIQEFANNFPKAEPLPFSAEPPLAKTAWVPEAPYPRIYTKDYRKTILSTLKQTIGKT
jgi:hypothetical protein